MVKFLEHPLAVHATFLSRVVEDVNLPERQEKFAFDGITHDRFGAHVTGTVKRQAPGMTALRGNPTAI
jgi:hypothetical protein